MRGIQKLTDLIIFIVPAGPLNFFIGRIKTLFLTARGSLKEILFTLPAQPVESSSSFCRPVLSKISKIKPKRYITGSCLFKAPHSLTIIIISHSLTAINIAFSKHLKSLAIIWRQLNPSNLIHCISGKMIMISDSIEKYR